MAPMSIVEGKWEELLAHSADFAGHRVRLIFLDVPQSTLPPLSDEEFERLLDELGEVGGDIIIDPNETHSRETIYFDHD